ncbi:hypothetical protein KR222_003783, partial [Zaprionus bogoriensis]
ANISIFRETLERNILLNTEISSSQDIEDAINILMRNIQEAAAAASRGRLNSQQNICRVQVRHGTELDEQATRLLRIKKECKRLLITTRTPESKRRYRQAQNKLKKAIKNLKNNNINKQLEHINTKDRYMMQKLWKLTSKLKRQPQANHPLKIQTAVNGGVNANNTTSSSWTKTTAEKAEAFTAHLEDRFQVHLSSSSAERDSIRDEWRCSLRLQQQQLQEQHRQPIRPVTLPELKLEIAALDLTKSPGEDRIDNKLINLLPQKAQFYIILIYNSILRIGHFPQI